MRCGPWLCGQGAGANLPPARGTECKEDDVDGGAQGVWGRVGGKINFKRSYSQV